MKTVLKAGGHYFACIIYYQFSLEEARRKKFFEQVSADLTVPKTMKVPPIRRSNIYEDVIALYSAFESLPLQQLNVEFEGENGVDFGGLTKDLFEAFWQEAYRRLFDGSQLLTPVLCPGINPQHFLVLGKILSHGYIIAGYLPIKIAFPCLAGALLGSNVCVPESILMETFMGLLSTVEISTVTSALEGRPDLFSSDKKVAEIVDILSRFDCRRKPTPQTIQKLLKEAACSQLVHKPLAAVTMLHSGQPQSHKEFWDEMSIDDLHAVYDALSASPSKVLEMIEEPTVILDPAQDTVLGYLRQFIGNLNQEGVHRFLRFVTGASVCTSKNIQIYFHGGHFPSANTCGPTLHLPTSYNTYTEFSSDFHHILNNDRYSWMILAV